MPLVLTASPVLAPDGTFAAEVRRLVADDQFSGVVLGAMGPETDPWVICGGMADMAARRPIARDTVFGMASMTKMFTAVAIGQLVAAGKLHWDDPVARFLPKLQAEWSGTITIRHLLTHTSGLGDYLDDPAFVARRGTLHRAEEYLEFIERQTPTSTPGTRFAYSNAGFILLGAIVEAVSGGAYWNYIQANILAPAGMASTHYLIGADEAAAVLNLARGYTRRPENSGGGPIRLRPGPDGSLPPLRPVEFIAQSSAAGGAFSTVDDLLKFARALQSDVLLPPSVRDLMFSPQVTPEGMRAPRGVTLKHGLGFGVRDVRGNVLVGHNGGAPGTAAQFDLLPNGGVLVVLANDDMALMPVLRAFHQSLPARQ